MLLIRDLAEEGCLTWTAKGPARRPVCSATSRVARVEGSRSRPKSQKPKPKSDPRGGGALEVVALKRPETGESCCRFAVQQTWEMEDMLCEPCGVHPTCNRSGGALRYHASFPVGVDRAQFLGCFVTKLEAALAWDSEARKRNWSAFNIPMVGEKAIQSVVAEHFARFRSSGFPYPTNDSEWRQAQLEELLQSHPLTAWRPDNILQLGDHEVAPGVQLCWSFHPHSFAVSKTRGMQGDLVTKPSPLDTFNSDAGLLKCIRTSIQRHGDLDCLPTTIRGECKYHDTSLTFKGGGSWITNFQPVVAAAIYSRYGGLGGVVYDSSAGWGGRLLGARLAGVRKYIACEPSTASLKGLQELADLAAGPMVVELHCQGSEDFQPEQVDMAFTSPPYFNTESYSNEPTQSHLKFPSAEEWCESFLKRTLANTWEAVKPGGYMVISMAGRRTHRRAGLDMETEVKRIAKQVGARLDHILSMQKLGQSVDTAQPVFVFRKTAGTNDE